MKTIIEMAREAGLVTNYGGRETASDKLLECFADLVRADEREVLAQPKQEPAACVIDNGTPEGATEWIPFTNRVEPLKTGDLLYGEPPQRPWVGLTQKEREAIQLATLDLHGIPKFFATAIEAKLKEKNT